MIQLHHIHKSFGDKIILDDLSYTFEQGMCYGIVGENGAGKTTLFRCISGLENYKGEIISGLEPLKDHTGYLQTESFFFEKMTGLEYIRLMLLARHIRNRDILSQNIFDLPLDQYVSTYSTGMKKKLALTAVLLQGNDLFILDEPYNGVDIHSNILITEIIRKLKSMGKTLLISSHIFSTLTETCDVICLLKNGRFTHSATHTDFHLIEQEMKNELITSKIDKLDIS